MYKVLIFAGTTEGIILCNLLAKNRISTYVCVATEYGSHSFEKSEYLSVHANRLTTTEMEELFQKIHPEIVLDATHPYAAEVTKNIQNACEKTGFWYQRVLRSKDYDGEKNENIHYVESTEEAISYLENTKGNILLTTGSKELAKYTTLSDYENRLYARVLSLPSVLETCSTYGIVGKHLIGMQGPFSKELNEAMLRQYDCKYLVTKDTGKAGGFQEKIEAALACGVIPVVIGRPLQETGMNILEAKQMLSKKFGFSLKSQVTLLGIGMGTEETLTIQGKHALESADLIIGAKRMVDSVRKSSKQADVFYEYKSEQIAAYIQEHPEYERIVIALSGDVGFYSGAKKLLQLLGSDTEVICGISSAVYFMSKIGLSWDDAKLVSAHGKNKNLISHIKHHEKVFAILGNARDTAELAQKLTFYGMGEVILFVGENLSYEKEVIFAKKAKELMDYQGEALCVICAYNPKFIERKETHGVSDSEFIRGKAPMTKEEVRTVSLAKLRLTKDAICYDVGAGTGSISIEMALRAMDGSVFAIEMKEDALALLEENKRKFATDNLEIISGMAPEALENLPAPTHAFIGGSSGNLKEIVGLLLRKNRNVRIVINCISLETVTETLQVMKEFDFQEQEIVQVNVSKSKTLGRYHMMMGENPISIMVCQYPNL